MIHTEGLTRHFTVKKERVEAVRGIDLDVAEGELVALLGPNGAGKSTTLRMLTSLLPPTAGTAIVAGRSVTEDPAGVRKRIGYVGQGNGAGHYYRVIDELLMQGRFYGMGKQESKQRAEELLKGLDLRDLAKRAVMTLSGGQRRRLDIAMGLMHRPRLMFLDEPSTGMDPQNRANLWEHILRMRADHGTTIVLTTHYLEEADTMAERIVVIDNGLVIADDTAAKPQGDAGRRPDHRHRGAGRGGKDQASARPPRHRGRGRRYVDQRAGRSRPGTAAGDAQAGRRRGTDRPGRAAAAADP